MDEGCGKASTFGSAKRQVNEGSNALQRRGRNRGNMEVLKSCICRMISSNQVVNFVSRTKAKNPAFAGRVF